MREYILYFTEQDKICESNRLVTGPKSHIIDDTKRDIYQSERSQDGQTLNTRQTKFNQTKYHYNGIEAVPATFEVIYRAQRDQLHPGFYSENCGKYLEKNDTVSYEQVMVYSSSDVSMCHILRNFIMIILLFIVKYFR